MAAITGLESCKRVGPIGPLRSSGLPVAGIDLWVDPAPPGLLGVPVASDAAGSSDVPLPLVGSPSLVGMSLYGQFVWAEVPAPCAPTGLSASSGLQITIQ